MLKAIVNSPVRSGNQTILGGDLIIGTAGEGINFTANTPAAGMTSQLLNWYEEGTWTPTDASGAGLTLTSAHPKYTRIGRQVTVSVFITYPSTSNVNAAVIGGLPFTSSSAQQSAAALWNSASVDLYGFVDTSTANIILRDAANSGVTNATLSGRFVCFSFSYIAA